MARLQALKQQRFIESSGAPTTSFQVEGGSGVPKMHPLKSSNPILKATSMLHSLRSGIGSGLRMPRIKPIHMMRMPGTKIQRMPRL